MNSKGWKVSLFAMAAVIGLSACGERKKAKPVSPFAGIWINQQNVSEYQRHGGQPKMFCDIVYKNRSRYADSQYRVKALAIQPNGEVLRYSASEGVPDPASRQSNYLGIVNSAGQFTGGIIGPDGRVAANVYGYSAGDMPARSVFSLAPGNPNVLRYYGWNNAPEIATRQSAQTVSDYSCRCPSASIGSRNFVRAIQHTRDVYLN